MNTSNRDDTIKELELPENGCFICVATTPEASKLQGCSFSSRIHIQFVNGLQFCIDSRNILELNKQMYQLFKNSDKCTTVTATTNTKNKKENTTKQLENEDAVNDHQQKLKEYFCNFINDIYQVSLNIQMNDNKVETYSSSGNNNGSNSNQSKLKSTKADEKNMQNPELPRDIGKKYNIFQDKYRRNEFGFQNVKIKQICSMYDYYKNMPSCSEAVWFCCGFELGKFFKDLYLNNNGNFDVLMSWVHNITYFPYFGEEVKEAKTHFESFKTFTLQELINVMKNDKYLINTIKHNVIHDKTGSDNSDNNDTKYNETDIEIEARDTVIKLIEEWKQRMEDITVAVYEDKIDGISRCGITKEYYRFKNLNNYNKLKYEHYHKDSNNCYWYYIPSCEMTCNDKKRELLCWGTFESNKMSQILKEHVPYLNLIPGLCDLIGSYCGGGKQLENAEKLFQCYEKQVSCYQNDIAWRNFCSETLMPDWNSMLRVF